MKLPSKHTRVQGTASTQRFFFSKQILLFVAMFVGILLLDGVLCLFFLVGEAYNLSKTSDGRSVISTLSNSLEQKESGEYAVVNGRYFYLADGLYELGGEMLWPLKELARMFGCEITWDAASGSINVDLTKVELISSGDEYYNSQDVYWLSRIIYAESGNQPLAGQIAVGNVVLNRVASAEFPDSIYGVIFDDRWGGQFEPVRNGSIYQEPTEESVLAAKLVLEGASVAGNSLYFLSPSLTSNHWIMNNRPYVMTIGCHWFYA